VARRCGFFVVILFTRSLVSIPAGQKKPYSKSPLMVQGDHGPVAFRNLRIKLTVTK
jgi:hypothetical protein